MIIRHFKFILILIAFAYSNHSSAYLHSLVSDGDGFIAYMNIMKSVAEKNYNETPLTLAIFNNKIEEAEKLIFNGENVNEVGLKGLPPLGHALYINNLALAELLIKKGADVNFVPSQKWNIPNITDFLYHGGIFFPQHHCFGLPYLHSAVCRGDREQVVFLLEHHSHPKMYSNDQYSAMDVIDRLEKLKKDMPKEMVRYESNSDILSFLHQYE